MAVGTEEGPQRAAVEPDAASGGAGTTSPMTRVLSGFASAFPRLGRIAAPPKSLLGRSRQVFLLLTWGLVLAIVLLPFLEGGAGGAIPGRLAVGIALAGLSLRWLRLYLTESSSNVWDVFEAFGVLTVGLGAVNTFSLAGLLSLGLLYAGLWFRSLYGTRARVAAGAAFYIVARVIVVLAFRDGWGDAPALLLSLLQVPGFAMTVTAARVLAPALDRHQHTFERERVLIRTSAALVASPDQRGICAAGLEAMLALLADRDPETTARVALRSGPGWLVTSGRPGDPVPEPVQALSLAIPGLFRADLRAGRRVEATLTEAIDRAALGLDTKASEVFIVPLTPQRELAGYIAVASRAQLPSTIKDEIGALGYQIALAFQRQALTEDLREREAGFRSLVQNSSDIITVLEENAAVRYQTPTVERILGYAPENLEGHRLTEIVHPDDVRRAVAFVDELTARGDTLGPAEWRLRRADGSWLYGETIGNNLLDDPNVRGLVLTTRDVTERKTLEAELVHQAFHDPLTDLPNRAYFMDRLHQLLDTPQRRRGDPLAVLFLDLDRFKVINDSLGHEAGDQLLLAVSNRLKACVRTNDTVARLGGDEFALILEEVNDVSDATQTADRVLAQLQNPVILGGRELFVSTSIGIALGASDTIDADSLLRNADMALYAAKARGKACYAVFDQSMGAQAVERLELETEMRSALRSGEFAVHYQPLVLLNSGQISEVEALLRWVHPRRGLLYPREFLRLAEETGLILPIGLWVLREASRQVREWQKRSSKVPRLVLSVNLSAREFQDPDLLPKIEAVLQETGFDPADLKLEITEATAMEHLESTMNTLLALKRLGVQLVIDDFGTGASALGDLKRFPVDALKVDGSFVQGLSRDPGDMAIVRAVVAFAKTLRLGVTAEGIETAEQFARLRALGFDHGQGFYISAPLTTDAVSRLLVLGRPRGGATA